MHAGNGEFLGVGKLGHLALLNQRQVVDVGADDVDLLVQHRGGGVLPADVFTKLGHLGGDASPRNLRLGCLAFFEQLGFALLDL